MSMRFTSVHKYGTNVGGRLYMMDGDDQYYYLFCKG